MNTTSVPTPGPEREAADDLTPRAESSSPRSDGSAPRAPLKTPAPNAQLQYEAVLANASIGIALTRERRFFLCNDAFAAILGWTRAELTGQSGEVIYPDRTSFEALGAIAAPLLAAGERVDVEWELRRRDGAPVLCHLVAKAIDPLHPAQGTVWIVEDIGIQRRQAAELEEAKEKLASANDALEGMVAERTKELSEALARLEAEVAERRRAEERAQHLADHDALTGLPNRRILEDRLTQALVWHRRHGGHAAVLFLDLDRFKMVNDVHGHAVGDALLNEVAERLVGQLRGVDTICRIGGDEFVIVLPELARTADAASVAEKILARLAEPIVAGSVTVKSGSSVGISVFPGDGDDAPTLIRNADAALYAAKAAGRGVYKFFAEPMNASATRRGSVEAELREALVHGDLELHRQPLVDLPAGRIIGYEALLRWPMNSGNLLAPSEFFGIVTDAGLLAKLDTWVLGEACRQASELFTEGFVALNLSARQFSDPRFPEQLAMAVRAAGVPAGRLEIEVSEGVAMREPAVTEALFARIASLGVGLSIDQFGSAQSSLSFLRRFPLARLKVDRAIVNALPGSPEARDVIRAAVGIGRALGLAVGAVGVETHAQYDVLVAAGCDFAQGHLMGEPVAR